MASRLSNHTSVLKIFVRSVESVQAVRQWYYCTTVPDAISTYGTYLRVRATPVRFGSYCPISTEDWFQIWRETIGEIIEIGHVCYYAIVEDQISDALQKHKNTSVN